VLGLSWPNIAFMSTPSIQDVSTLVVLSLLPSSRLSADFVKLTPHRYADTKTALTARFYKDDAVAGVLSSKHPFRGLGEPDDIAGVAVFLASDDAKWVQSTGIAVDGGFTAQ
jgi:NAD(P)-dependent dehydrogenase (short-subunit alcohol dehydrogenase family)